ncbi:MAG: hypothetical protein PUB00_05020 [Clostridiales bacterium]|nr:hypothetical protein [Clostridiales bacterium]
MEFLPFQSFPFRFLLNLVKSGINAANGITKGDKNLNSANKKAFASATAGAKA